MGVLFGILAALCWGGGDFLIMSLTRRVGDVRALGWSQIVSLVLWLGMLFAFGGTPFDARSLATVLFAAVLHVVGLKLTYRAFEVGTLSLVSPLASGFAVVTAVLALAFGKGPAALALVGAALLVTGIGVATAAQGSGPRTLKGVPEAIGSAVAFGGMFYLFDGITSNVGYVGPLVVLKTLASLTFCLPQRKAVLDLKELTTSTAALVVAVSLADTLAWVAFIFGMRSESVSIVTAVASLFSVVTIVLAGFVLRERLRPAQWAGVAAILAGVLVVSLPH